MTTTRIRLSGPVVELVTLGGAELRFREEPLWELTEAVGQRMGVDTRWESMDDLRRVSAELEPIRQAVLNAAHGIVEELIDSLRRYAETGEEDDSVRYMFDCLRLIRKRKEQGA